MKQTPPRLGASDWAQRLKQILCVALCLTIYHCGAKSVKPQDADGPIITGFGFERQIPEDKRTVIFSFSYEAPGGKMATGKARFSSGSSPVEYPLNELFKDAGSDPELKKGTLKAAIRFPGVLQNGDRARVTLELVDGQGRRSNIAEVVIQFSL